MLEIERPGRWSCWAAYRDFQVRTPLLRRQEGWLALSCPVVFPITSVILGTLAQGWEGVRR